jgi:hypothetical protein
MKKLILFLFLLVSCAIYGQAQVKGLQYCTMVDGYWSAWKYDYIVMLQGKYDEFIIYQSYDHPSDYSIKVKIYGMNMEVDKKERKRRIKENQWYEYRGSIEYYTNDYHPNVKETLREQFLPGSFATAAQTGSKIHIRPATIRIAPYKKRPVTYNILFDGLGIGLSLN